MTGGSARDPRPGPERPQSSWRPDDRDRTSRWWGRKRGAICTFGGPGRRSRTGALCIGSAPPRPVVDLPRISPRVGVDEATADQQRDECAGTDLGRVFDIVRVPLRMQFPTRAAGPQHCRDVTVARSLPDGRRRLCLRRARPVEVADESASPEEVLKTRSERAIGPVLAARDHCDRSRRFVQPSGHRRRVAQARCDHHTCASSASTAEVEPFGDGNTTAAPVESRHRLRGDSDGPDGSAPSARAAPTERAKALAEASRHRYG